MVPLIDPDRLVCPRCKHSVDPRVYYCPSCGAATYRGINEIVK